MFCLNSSQENCANDAKIESEDIPNVILLQNVLNLEKYNSIAKVERSIRSALPTLTTFVLLFENVEASLILKWLFLTFISGHKVLYFESERFRVMPSNSEPSTISANFREADLDLQRSRPEQLVLQ